MDHILNIEIMDNLIWPLIVIIIAGIGGIIWRYFTKQKKIKESEKTSIKTNKPTNSPVTGKVKNQTINYYQTSPEVLKRLDDIENKIEEFPKPEKVMNENEKSKSINVTSNNQSGGITAGIVNISNQNQYTPLNGDSLNQVRNNLKELNNNFLNIPKIILEIENGNPLRHNLACDLEKLLQENNLGDYPKGNVYMGRFPDHPITVIGNQKNIDFLKKFVEAVNPYVSTNWYYRQVDTFPDEYLKIYINGNPTFDNNGLVSIS